MVWEIYCGANVQFTKNTMHLLENGFLVVQYRDIYASKVSFCHFVLIYLLIMSMCSLI